MRLIIIWSGIGGKHEKTSETINLPSGDPVPFAGLVPVQAQAYEKKGEKPTGWLSITDVAEDGTVSFRLDQIRRLYVKLDKVEVVIFPKGVESTEETVPGVAEEDIAARVELFKTEDGVYEGTADLGDLDLKKYSANVVAKTVTGEEYVLRKIRKLSAVIKK